MSYVPAVDTDITLTLPGEILRARVTRVVDRNTVFCEIGQPMTRNHSFRLGDLVAARRTAGVLGETWQAVENRPATTPAIAPEPIEPVAVETVAVETAAPALKPARKLKRA